jgi:hypothetical protein
VVLRIWLLGVKLFDFKYSLIILSVVFSAFLALSGVKAGSDFSRKR